MKKAKEKEFTRDYATAAFRFYARKGKPTYEEAVERVRREAMRRCEFCDPQIIVQQAETTVAQKTPELLDILAVNETLALLEKGGRGYIARAVREVYFIEPSAPLRKGTISARVRRLSLTMPASERSIYYWLKDARRLLASIRGLRIEDDKEYLQW